MLANKLVSQKKKHGDLMICKFGQYSSLIHKFRHKCRITIVMFSRLCLNAYRTVIFGFLFFSTSIF